MTRAVLFDFDFTLAESSSGVIESVNHALRALGLPEADPAAIRRTVGLSLRAKGVRTAVVSTKYRYRIEAVLGRDGLLDQFDAIVGGEDVARHKPDPEGLVAALGALGEKREHALYVGDHPVDAEAAAGAGLRFVAVLSGSSLREEFAGLPVEQFLGSLRELVACADGA